MSRRSLKEIKRKEKKKQGSIAMERIEILLKRADDVSLEGDFEMANMYVKKARTIGMKTNTRIPGFLKRKFCKFCYSHLLPGKTSIVRIKSKEKKVVVKCRSCGKEMYFPYVKEVKEKRRLKSSGNKRGNSKCFQTTNS